LRKIVEKKFRKNFVFSKLCVYFAKKFECIMAKKVIKSKTAEKVKGKPKPPSKPASKVVQKPAPKVASKPVPKAAVKVAPKPAPKVAAKPAPKPAPKVVSKPAPKPAPQATAPKNVIVSYNKIDDSLKLELIKKYPEGFANYVHRYPKPNGEFFFAVPLDVGDMHYMIKVEVKVDNLITEDEFDKHFGDIAEVDSKAISDVEVEVEEDDDDDDDDQPDEINDDDDDDE